MPYIRFAPFFPTSALCKSTPTCNVMLIEQRVMPHSFFVLARLFVRVDNVLFRMFDVRIYHAFDSDQVTREVSGMEAGYDDVKSVSLPYPTAM